MNLNSMSTLGPNWRPPDMPTRADPSDLAKLVEYGWRYSFSLTGADPVAPSFDAGRLIELAFDASAMPEEGEYLRFSLLTSHGTPEGLVVKFTAPYLLSDARKLKKLAVSCGRDHALVVREEGAHTLAVGLMKPPGERTYSHPDRPETVGVGGSRRLWIRVRGPGWLEVDVPLVGIFALRSGRVRELRSIMHLSPMGQIGGAVTEEVVATRPVLKREPAFGGPSGTGHLALQLLESVIDRVLDRGVGAMLIVTPDLDPNGSQFLKLSIPVEGVDVAKAVADLWVAAIGACDTEDAGSKVDCIRRVQESRSRLTELADTIASLAAMDGSVVLTRRLNVVGFGAEIRVPPESLKNGSPFRNLKTRDVTPIEQALDEFPGTRHKAALRYCSVQADAVVVVISHDRELRLFFSDADGVHGFEALTARRWF